MAPTFSEEHAQEVSRRTVQSLRDPGWCFWKCEALNGEVITILRDQPPLSDEEEMAVMKRLAALCDVMDPEKISKEWLGVPYTLTELRQLCKLDDKTMLLTHEAKKAGAEIESVEVAP